MFGAPHFLNKLKSLDYWSPMCFLSTHHIQQWNHLWTIVHSSSSHSIQMQNMDCNCNGHAWCKVKTSNNKNNFGLRFRSTRYLGHLHSNNDSSEHFFHSIVWNKVSWIGDFAQIPLAGQFAPRPHVYTVVCKFCIASLLCVNTYPCWMYYVIHKLQSLSRAVIHLGTHEHLVGEGMCKESLEGIKVLVEGQVFHTLDGKIFVISLNASKTFLAHHLFNENGEGLVEILQGEKLHKVMDKF